MNSDIMVTVEKGRIEIDVQPIDRAYGTTYSYGDSGYEGPRVMLTYSRFAEGVFHATPQRVKDQLVPDYQRYLRERDERGEYEISRRKRFLLTCDPQQLRAEILARIASETETTKLWTAGPGGIEGYVGHEVMTGKVPSRRSGRRSDVLSKWPVVLRTPIYKAGPGINYSALKCGCQDHDWDIAKGVSVVCVHIAAEIKRAWDEQADPNIPESSRRIKFVETKGPIYLPFNIPHLKAMDIIFRKYVFNEDMKEIDKREMGIPENYDPLFLQAIESGLLVFEVIRQKFLELPYRGDREKQMIVNRLKVLNDFKRIYLDYQLRKAGFKKVGIYALELKNTPLETVCETYERDNEIIRPVLRWDIPPILVHRMLGDQRQVFYTPDTSNPFSQPFVAREDIDDRTRRKGTKQIIIPGPRMPQGFDPVYIHPLFRQEYRRLISENYQGDTTQLIQQLGLGLV